MATVKKTSKAAPKKAVAKAKPVKKTTKKVPALPVVMMTPFWNIRDNGDAYKVSVSIPGLSKKNVKIEVNGPILTVSSEKEAAASKKDKQFVVKEYHYSAWSKSVALPQAVADEPVSVKYKDGVLKIELEKV
jgi:HSP20 family protein